MQHLIGSNSMEMYGQAFFILLLASVVGIFCVDYFFPVGNDHERHFRFGKDFKAHAIEHKKS